MEYIIGAVSNQIILFQTIFDYTTPKSSYFCKFGNIGQYYLGIFFSIMMIHTKTWYKIHNQELLAIVEVFKT